ESAAGQPFELWRAVSGDAGHPAGVRAAHSRPAGRSHRGYRRPPRFRADPADARATHPPGKGELEYLHQRGAPGAGRRDLHGVVGEVRLPQGVRTESAQGRLRPGGDPPDPEVRSRLRYADVQRVRHPDAAVPGVSEVAVLRHYTRLSHRNFSIDEGFYPLGSCTMKYNPKIHEDAARLPGFARLHPYVPAEHAQGALRLMWELEQLLAEISGMDRVTFQPAAGAHGELTGLLMIRAYFAARGERRTKVIVPDSAHGTNPATASMVGYQVVTVKSDARGNM